MSKLLHILRNMLHNSKNKLIQFTDQPNVAKKGHEQFTDKMKKAKKKYWKVGTELSINDNTRSPQI